VTSPISERRATVRTRSPVLRPLLEGDDHVPTGSSPGPGPGDRSDTRLAAPPARVAPPRNTCQHRNVTLHVGELAGAAELLKTLGNPVRLGIVTVLADGERCVHELVEATGVSQPLVSQHLRVLRSAHLVTGTRRGREVAYRLADHHVAHIAADAVLHAEEAATERREPRPRSDP
jgi:ArsR family transcriptional regulator, zinc-responsive transcriptional repressor